jgi:hypothetical protein
MQLTAAAAPYLFLQAAVIAAAATAASSHTNSVSTLGTLHNGNLFVISTTEAGKQKPHNTGSFVRTA